ncbi:ORF6N domain-containing protein, partial [Bacillus licheniformis]|uniref:ORF6N domain-containing protein n=1 Tax=Bacillus licheniformis TaxID=1402 RepID=UPI0011147828
MNLSIIERNNQRVLTTAQLAESYGAEEKLVQQNFNNNKKRYKEGKHFILLQGDDLRTFKRDFEILGVAPNINKLYLWTEKGAWLHAKSLNTDQAWDAYEMLVDEYYNV